MSEFGCHSEEPKAMKNLACWHTWVAGRGRFFAALRMTWGGALLLLFAGCGGQAVTPAPAAPPPSTGAPSSAAAPAPAKPSSVDHLKLSLSTYAGVFAPFVIAED